MPKDKHATFEELYRRLEDAVNKLEAGGMPLEDAIALYEEGMSLARECQERLDSAELKITRLRESFAAIPARQAGEEPLDEDLVARDDDLYADEEP